MLALKSAHIPWSGAPILATENLRAFFAEKIPEARQSYLPIRVQVYSGHEVGVRSVERFLELARDWLVREFERRHDRVLQFVTRGEFTAAQITRILKAQMIQPWVIFYSKEGGLPVDIFDHSERKSGLIPCTSLDHHGVAWRRGDAGAVQTWLVTARGLGEAWRMDSDIGHESAHAAFATMPVFGQSVEEHFSAYVLTENLSNWDVRPGHFARVCALISEITVTCVRGELRDTDTSLPVTSLSELVCLLQLAELFFPDKGFARAADWCDSNRRSILGRETDNPNHVSYVVGAPALRAIRQINSLTAELDVAKAASRLLVHSKAAQRLEWLQPEALPKKLYSAY